MAHQFRNPRLAIPVLPARLVSRPRLLGTLEPRDGETLTLLSAGAGTGKTVLLTDWARRQSTAPPWLNISPLDDAPARFLGLLLAALAPGYDTSETPSHGRSPAASAASLLELLESRKTDVLTTVVLDDAHLLTDPDILFALNQIITQPAYRIHLVLACRSDPLLPLHRYRLSGQMRELRTADLSMTRPEIQQLLAAHGLRLSDRDVGLLAHRTEGWVAGLRLSALQLEHAESPSEVLEDLVLSRGSIAEYLFEEVLKRLPLPIRNLLIRTSFLPEVTGSLADAITGSEGSGELLGRLEAENSFVVPTDKTRTRFRYHQLFGEVLKYVLASCPDEVRAEAYQRAAEWFRASGDLEAALHWSIEADNDELTESILISGGLAGGVIADVAGLDFDSGGLDRIAARRGPVPESSSEWAIIALTADESAAALLVDEINPGAPQDAAAVPSDPYPTMLLAEFMLARRAGRMERVDSVANQILQMGEQNGRTAPGLRAAVLVCQVQARMLLGNLDGLQALCAEAAGLAAAENLPSLEAHAWAELARVETFLSRFDAAETAITRTQDILAGVARPPRPVSLDLALAHRALAMADLPAMRQALARIIPVDRPAMTAPPEQSGLILLVALHLCCGELADARSVLALITPDDRLPGLLAARRDAARAAIDMSLGRPHSALRVLAPYQRSPLGVHVQVSAARAHLALNELVEAEDSLRLVVTATDPVVSRYVLVEANVCAAEIGLRRGEEPRAVETLIHALDIANGDVRMPFVLATTTFAELLQRHSILEERWPGLTPLSGGDADAIPGPHAAPDLADPLTNRERSVLRLLATSMSPEEIAAELCVSVNTVKTHQAAIYRKLSARRRRDAVFRARKLELL